MTDNLLDQSREDLLAQAITGVDDELMLVSPSEETLTDLIDVLADHDVRVDVLADPATVKGVMDDFIVASNAADLIASDRLSLRTSDALETNPMLVGSSSVMTLVTTASSMNGLVSEDESFVGDVRTEYRDRWAEAAEYSLRTPPLSEVNDGLAESLGDDAEGDFRAMLGSLETARGDDSLDEVTVSLLVAAKNEALLYDISKWGEDTGVASKATFSRTKTRLEEKGLIETEKVPIEVGRPRLRLTLADERLQAAESDQIATAAQSMLT
ncbi:transcriptional regulator TbsP [Natranaeroarchaeum aerophilus]|uniref:DUF5821 family protein n=1 Tax=Natranaeroarchaeum aerophilus TaxID=2917711 RepID=A0AAE3K4Y0_9EURY|nr:DUF5821 family protein [Natranaeroarchaeum aerophilus]MCL9813852.1 DUF5821 family protein [Natranaeroarchaeum aerophilus]